MKKTRLFALLLSCVLILSTVASPVVSAQAASIATPTSLKATALGSSSIKLTWTAVSGAKNYQIYGGTSTGAMVLASTVTTATGTLTALTSSTTYYYKVRAIPTTGSAGAFTAAVSAKTKAGIAAPTGVKATSASSAQINLS